MCLQLQHISAATSARHSNRDVQKVSHEIGHVEVWATLMIQHCQPLSTSGYAACQHNTHTHRQHVGSDV